ncbi:terpene synthase family protein [Nocardia thraciensis]
MVDHRAVEWIRARGLCATGTAERKLEDTGVGDFVGRLFPHSSTAALEAIAKLHLWGFAFDDQIEQLATHDLPAATDWHYRIMRVLDAPESTSATDPYTTALLEIAADFQELATPAVYERWVDHHREFAAGAVWAGVHRRAGTVPTPDTVTLIRRLDAASYDSAISLIELAGGFELAAADLTRPDVRALADIVSVLLAWDNDIYSHPIEVEHGIDQINLVTALAHHSAPSTHQAVIDAIHMRNQAMWCYTQRRARLQPPEGTLLHRYVRGLDDLIRGHLDWARHGTSRYDTGRERIPLTLHEEPATTVHRHDLTQPLTLPSIHWWWTSLR